MAWHMGYKYFNIIFQHSL